MASSKEKSSQATKSLVAQFTKRDLMLYALGIGCYSDNNDDKEDNNDRELCFVYEHHPKFEAFPTFLLALSFVAEQQQSEGVTQSTTSSRLGFGIRPFPPESMTNYLDDGSRCGILPKEFYKNQDDIEEIKDLPILHMSQSLILHDKIKLSEQTGQDVIDPATRIQLETRILSVKPRNIGTFVTSETTYHQDGKCIATAQMVALILGMDPEIVVPLKAPQQQRSSPNKNNTPAQSPSRNTAAGDERRTVLQYIIPQNAALLYRLSGDYNSIHVEDNLLGSKNDQQGSKLQKKGPILHGLCTLGYALRAVLHHVDHRQFTKSHEGENSEVMLESVRCNFVKPVYVGEALRIEVWDDKGYCANQEEIALHVCFRVHRDLGRASDEDEKEIDTKKHFEVVVDRGMAQFCLKSMGSKLVQAVSRL